MALCTCENVTFTYPDTKEPTLRNISMSITKGEFVVICGQSGCGKTTLLRHLKPELKPYGKRDGRILYKGQDIYTQSIMANTIGYVMQDPNDQIVTDKVWHEMAFGLENQGLSSIEIRRRCAEMATFFGMETWFHKPCHMLSGGQKQMLNLASIMLMQPELLLLDEPLSQLDPIAVKEFLNVLKLINAEFGTTILMVEHHLEDVVAYADRIMVMEIGKLICDETPTNLVSALSQYHQNHPLFEGLPAPMRIFHQFPKTEQCPIQLKDGKRFLDTYFHKQDQIVSPAHTTSESLITIQHLYFRYDKKEYDVVKHLSLAIQKQDIYAILGANGAGKSTLLRLLCGQLHPQRGNIIAHDPHLQARKKTLNFDQIGYIPQDPTSLFMQDRVSTDLEMMCEMQKNKQFAYKQMHHWVEKLHLTHVLHQHPYDLSGGERQRLALCKVLIKDIQFLCMDEPTKGLDAYMKKELGEILTQLCKAGLSVLFVSHDIEFCAQYANHAALMFDGEVIAQGDTTTFFKQNHFYTTQAHKMAREQFPHAITCKDVIDLCRVNQK